jgi:hypothetical protein
VRALDRVRPPSNVIALVSRRRAAHARVLHTYADRPFTPLASSPTTTRVSPLAVFTRTARKRSAFAAILSHAAHVLAFRSRSAALVHPCRGFG